jgi:glucokinase
MLLAGDIGGTKTDLAVFSTEQGPRVPLVQGRFPSDDYPGLEAMVGEFLARTKLPVRHACFAVAGPVAGGRAKLTNLPWVLDEEGLRDAFHLRSVRLLNDLAATAHAVPLLQPDDLHTLHEGAAAPRGAVAVIAPGTGLGEAFLTWDGTAYQAHPSEGGHCDFAPLNPRQAGLLRYLQDRFGHVSYERVCSGLGIPNIYDYLRDSGHSPESPKVVARLAGAEDRTPPILESALDPHRPCPLCAATLEVFVAVLGAEAGNLALKVLATGGIYVAGGIPPRVLPALEGGRFLQALRGKGRFIEMLGSVPVHVILHQVALLGAATHGLRAAGLARQEGPLAMALAGGPSRSAEGPQRRAGFPEK